MRVGALSALLWVAAAGARAVAPRSDHPYIRPSGDDRRSPCPGLNTMANHGYLPRDGKNLDLAMLVKAQHEVFNLAVDLATGIATLGLALCGTDGVLNLDDLDAHEKMEHDSSLTRADASTGDDHTINPEIVHQVLSFSSDGVVMTWDDFARARAAREASLFGGRLNLSNKTAAAAEAVFSHNLFLDASGRGARLDFLRTWYLEERLPDGWVAPIQEQSLERTQTEAATFIALVDTYRYRQ
ncbi:hypothetical protein BOTBODRAFT_26035 [Botryobasidium botryosum FD-172 SS1]|uniref:Heme haloperoxidase family profile domain-containing protein n=1 Tax=Botryobasidium botryosum (strain FD-172 SS1) TaxID=930990 RepID=A0A067N159_BOTB1|nr:hypothetical protein BOTBODRAFT_26035 [Botryobasidium botryosum FD-172 SS1]